MTLEEQLRAYAAKGELVHVSLAFSNGRFHCNFAAASPASGYSHAEHSDPVEAIYAAFKASPGKRARISARPERESEPAPERAPEAGTESGASSGSDVKPPKEGSLPSEWTS